MHTFFSVLIFVLMIDCCRLVFSKYVVRGFDSNVMYIVLA